MNEKNIGYYLTAARPVKNSKSSFTESVMAKLPKQMKQKEFLFKRIPAFAVIAIIVAVAALLSGSAYAAYKLLWAQPQVHVTSQTVSKSGRDQVVISFTSCDKKDVATHYELKKNAPITQDEVPLVVQAHCELDAIGAWASTAFPHTADNAPMAPAGQPYDRVMLDTNMVTTIKSKDDSNITFTGLTKYNQQDVTLPVPSTVRYVVNGQDAKASDIKVGDTVTYVTSEAQHLVPGANCTATSCSYSGTNDATTLLAVVKVDMPIQYYDQLAWQSLTEIDTCTGNSNDNCLTGYSGGIDLYEPGTVQNGNTGAPKEIQGTIKAIDGAVVTIQSSSGTLFTITAPTDVFSAYNANKAAQYYNSQFVTVGKSLAIRYNEDANQHGKAIAPSQLESISLMIELISKGDPVTAY